MAPGRNATIKIGLAMITEWPTLWQAWSASGVSSSPIGGTPAVPAADVHDNLVARIPADLRGCGEIGGPVQVGRAHRATFARDLARTWRSPDAQPSNSTSDVAPVSMNLGSSSGCCRFGVNPGTHVTADTTPTSANHGKKPGWYRPLG